MASLKYIARECAKNLKNKNIFAIIKKYEKSWESMLYTTDANDHVVSLGGMDIQKHSPDAAKDITQMAFISAYDNLVLHEDAVALDYETIYNAEGKATIAACEKAIREAYENKGKHTAQDFKYFHNLTDEEKAWLKEIGVESEDEQEEETILDVETNKKTITGSSSISKTDYVPGDESAKNRVLRLNIEDALQTRSHQGYFKATEIAKNLKVKYKTLTKLFYTQLADLADLSNRKIPIISKRETTEIFLTDSQALFLVLCLPNMPQITAIKKEIARQVSQRAPPKIKLKS